MSRHSLKHNRCNKRSLSVAMIGTRGLPASYGGVEVAVEALSQELAKRGHRVSVYGRSAYCDQQLCTPDGVEQIALPQINTKHLEAISHTALATFHAVASRRFDVIHFHATGPTILSLSTRPLRIPTVSTVHGLDWRREKWGVAARQTLRLAARVAATVPDRTIAVSQELAQFLHLHYGTNSRYIPNGVRLANLDDQTPVPGLRAGEFILHLGRVVPEKQAHLLIQAFRKIEGNHRLAIVGPSSHSDAYVRYVEELASHDERVMLLGARYGAEKTWLLRNATAFVQPSTLEGLPISLLEALAVDQFTIVSNIPENVEAVTLVGDRPHGLVFRAGDVDDLACQLATALSRSRSSSPLPEISQVVRTRYDWERIAGETELVYREALSREPVRA